MRDIKLLISETLNKKEKSNVAKLWGQIDLEISNKSSLVLANYGTTSSVEKSAKEIQFIQEQLELIYFKERF